MKVTRILTFILFLGLVMTMIACSPSADENLNDDITDDDNITDEPIDEEPVDEEPIDEEPIDEEPIDEEPIDEEPIDEEPIVEMNATLTEINVDGVAIMDFNAETNDYVMVLSANETITPSITVVAYDATATIAINDAVDVTSSVAADRTTSITVTTSDGGSIELYTITFETNQLNNVDLGTANDFVILAESGISTETSSVVTGNIGVSPVAATYITGFSLTLDSTGTFSTSSQITGNVYASDYTSPTPSNLTTAIADMRTAYNDAAGRTANYLNLYTGDLSGKTLTHGVYNFGSGVLINDDLTLHGTATDVFIFQIDGALTQAAAVNVILTGGLLAENIIWQVADTVSIGTGAHFEGTILAMTNISLGTNASINGKLYAQTAVTLDASTVTKPE